MIRELEVVGEATKRLSLSTRQLGPKVPWKDMAGFKDVAIHQYDAIDVARVWAIVQEELPALVPLIRRLLTQLD
ncbi:MAG: DUF86 domain-containing protein [Thermoplasmata archaeon]|nr:DUF86 domain-containing protein [Thermoplasmata archaeon]